MDPEDKQPQGAETPDTPADEPAKPDPDPGQGDEPDTTDWKAEALKYKAIAKRREEKLAEVLKGTDGKPATPATDDKYSALQAELDQLKLQQLGIDDETIKKEIVAYAKLNNISYAAAKDSDYIKFKLKQAEEQKREDEASITPSPKSFTKKDFLNAKPSDFPRGKEGDEAWEEYKAWLKQQG